LRPGRPHGQRDFTGSCSWPLAVAGGPLRGIRFGAFYGSRYAPAHAAAAFGGPGPWLSRS